MNRYPPSLQPSGRQQCLNWPDYPSYQADVRALICETRLDLNDATNIERIIDANAPYALQPERGNGRGVILVHGLYDSPLLTRDFGHYLCAQGYLVYGILLPGHGTVPGDMLDITLEAWQAALNWAVRTLQSEVTHIELGGFSTGGALALQYAYSHPAVQRLWLFAPALKIKNPLSLLLGWLKPLSYLFPHAAWIENNRIGYDYAKYTLMASNAAHQVHRLTVQCRALRKTPLPIPHFIVTSVDDEVICSQDTRDYFQILPHSNSRLIQYTRNPQPHPDSRLLERNSCYPDQNIDRFSHQGLMIHPDNPHYGQQGDFQVERLAQLQQQYGLVQPKIIFGAQSNYPKLKKMKEVSLQLTYNPDFQGLCQLADSVLN